MNELIYLEYSEKQQSFHFRPTSEKNLRSMEWGVITCTDRRHAKEFIRHIEEKYEDGLGNRNYPNFDWVLAEYEDFSELVMEERD